MIFTAAILPAFAANRLASQTGRWHRRRQEPKMTTREYLDTPESVLPSELAYGELRVRDSPAVSHQRVVRDLTIALDRFVRERQLGEVLPAPMDVVLDREADLVVQPDILFVSAARRHLLTSKVDGAPDLVVEVLSPNPRIGRTEEKVTWYARYGVRECWLVHLTRRQLVVLGFEDGRVASRALFDSSDDVRSAVFNGLRLRPADVAGWW
jgi:Uma2 family endonuclease